MEERGDKQIPRVRQASKSIEPKGERIERREDEPSMAFGRALLTQLIEGDDGGAGGLDLEFERVHKREHIKTFEAWEVSADEF
ncbi:hypothetical protein M8C21_000857 [Ambrosia artemisiifolia]|uniref:Uncharacterized protein n=1 Tax=Ambrosia artemisiifolia TaxID=4212 RepID=A0AAD5CGX1_AMBAR|nr:hypothetical protein M8C21_000857 [Ambrosia artemisiifolia]